MKDESENLSPATENALHAALSEASPEMAVEDVKELLETTEKGQIKSCFTNAVTILSYDPLLRDSVRYNELTQRVDIVKDLGWERRDGKALVDNDLHNIHYYCERTYGITALKTIEEAVHMVANRNAYHPVRDFLNSLKWDGQERVRYALHRYLGADTSDYTYEILKFFMLGAVSRVFRPGVKFDYIICVVGDQGAGKSSFFRLLAVKDEWFTDDLKDLESNKVYEKLQGHWIIELSEMLATNNAKSNEAIKSFLSRQKEIYRTPYERYPKDRPRQCVFAGTTNKISFLPSAEKDPGIHVSDDGIRVVFVDCLQLRLRLQHQTGGNLTASDGRHQLFEIRDLTDIGCLVNEASYMHRQPSAIDIICLLTKQIEHLRVDHGNQEVERRISIRHDEKKCYLPVSQRIQFQLIIHGDVPDLLNIKGRQTCAAAHKYTSRTGARQSGSDSSPSVSRKEYPLDSDSLHHLPGHPLN